MPNSVDPHSPWPHYHPGSGEFLLGDVPALTVRRDTRQVGVLGGIALHDAHSVFMPIGPGHVASLRSSPRSAELTPDLVEDVNARQVQDAIEHVYMRPWERAGGFREDDGWRGWSPASA